MKDTQNGVKIQRRILRRSCKSHPLLRNTEMGGMKMAIMSRRQSPTKEDCERSERTEARRARIEYQLPPWCSVGLAAVLILFD